MSTSTIELKAHLGFFITFVIAIYFVHHNVKSTNEVLDIQTTMLVIDKIYKNTPKIAENKTITIDRYEEKFPSLKISDGKITNRYGGEILITMTTGGYTITTTKVPKSVCVKLLSLSKNINQITINSTIANLNNISKSESHCTDTNDLTLLKKV